MMASYLFNTDYIERTLEDFILEKTEGVPFFIEEFIRSLKDLKIIEKKGNRYHLKKDVKDVIIPSTIRDVIMARIDSLSESAKEVLQTGSVIEREFNYNLIKRVMILPAAYHSTCYTMAWVRNPPPSMKEGSQDSSCRIQ
jgi:predicted ATPase